MLTTNVSILSSDTPDAATWLADASGPTGAVALVNKEKGWTSFDVVAKLRSLTGIRKIGHAGTLDPLATGLLIVCLGKATKLVSLYQDADKEYRTTIKLGAVTATDDAGAHEQLHSGAEYVDSIGDTAVHRALANQVGVITQIPPAVSAIKHKGQRQYDLVRKGVAFTPHPRIVTVYDITDIVIDLPLVSFTVTCSKGTYIRSIARDVGNELECGAYAVDLHRTAIGEYRSESALTISEVAACIREGGSCD